MTRVIAALCALTLSLLLLPSGAPARAQDSSPGEGGVAPPSSRTPTTPLRDPTRAPSWRRIIGSRSGVTLPQVHLRGRVVSRRGAVALLEIDGQLHVVRAGDQLTLRLNGAATPAPQVRGRRAQPAPARGSQTLTLRVRKLDARVLELEFVELSQTLTLR